MELSGKVVKRAVAPGSKSERQAVLLDTGNARYILRRKEGHPFTDELLEGLVGKDIHANGDFIGGGTFLMSGWKELS